MHAHDNTKSLCQGTKKRSLIRGEIHREFADTALLSEENRCNHLDHSTVDFWPHLVAQTGKFLVQRLKVHYATFFFTGNKHKKQSS